MNFISGKCGTKRAHGPKTKYGCGGPGSDFSAPRYTRPYRWSIGAVATGVHGSEINISEALWVRNTDSKHK